jgi:hypothetical protein
MPDPMISANRSFVGILGQENEGYRRSSVKKLGKQFDRGSVFRCILEKNKTTCLSLLHCFGFVQRSGVIQFRREAVLVAAEDLANKKKVFFLVSYQ